jgi:hypothetical protein
MADELKNTKMEHWQNDNDEGKLKYLEKNCPTATLSTTNPTWAGLEKPGHLR